MRIRWLFLFSNHRRASQQEKETYLLAGRSTSRSRSGLTNVLVVTTTMRVINGVHDDTSSLDTVERLTPHRHTLGQALRFTRYLW